MNENKYQNDSKYLVTTSMYEASFLFAKKAQLVNIDKTGGKRAEFVFKSSPELMDLVDAFKFSPENDARVMVDARMMATSIRALKERLYSA